MNILRKKYPIEAKLREGYILLMRNELEARLYGGVTDGFEYDLSNDIVTLGGSYVDSTKKVVLHGGITKGDIWSIYVENVYDQIPVNQKTVIDIGANIADSCIYFALRGADKVIGLEPMPKNYELAIKNVESNNLSDKITILLAGCGAFNGEITVAPSYEAGIGIAQKDLKYGVKVPLQTIDQILNNYSLVLDNSIILKMDCDGCEYETILSTDDRTIQKFSHIMMEYHFGYRNLKEKIEKSGFKVSVTRPHIHTWNSLKLQSGFLFAEKY